MIVWWQWRKYQINIFSWQLLTLHTVLARVAEEIIRAAVWQGPGNIQHITALTKARRQKNFFAELFRVSDNQIIFGANHFIDRIPFNSSCWIVWDKENGDSDFAHCELAWSSFNTAVRKFRFKWQGMLQGDMRHKEIRIHPNQKPVKLYEWLLTHYAKPGDKILDTHVGSASSLIACYNLGFDFLGFEIDRFYFEQASQRIKEAQAQLRLSDFMKI